MARLEAVFAAPMSGVALAVAVVLGKRSNLGLGARLGALNEGSRCLEDADISQSKSSQVQVEFKVHTKESQDNEYARRTWC